MNDTRTGDALVADYLRLVDLLLDHLPRARRQEILEGLAEHIADARAALTDESDSDLAAILQRVGTPEQIAAAEAQESGPPARRHPGGIEIVTMIALLAGMVMLPLVSLFIATAVMWFSKLWGRRDKLIVTALAAIGAAALVGYGAIFFTGGDEGPSSALGITGLVVSLGLWVVSALVSPIIAAWLLGRRIWTFGGQPVTAQAAPEVQAPHPQSQLTWPTLPPPAADPALLARRRRARNWLAVLAVVLLVGGAVALAFSIRSLVGGVFPNGAVRVAAPGTATITLDAPGTYEIAHEYEPLGPPDEDGFSGPPSASPNNLELVPAGGGVGGPIDPVQDGSMYGTLNREGVTVARFTIERPGRYVLTAGYPDGAQGPPTTLVVGRDDYNPVLALVGLGLGLCALSLGLLLAVVALIVHFTGGSRRS